MTSDFERDQKNRAAVAQWATGSVRRAVRQFTPAIMHGLGQKDFWELPPRERALIYAVYPPILMDGTIPGPTLDPEDGLLKWDWLGMSQEQPEEYNRHLVDYAERIQERMVFPAAEPASLPFIGGVA